MAQDAPDAEWAVRLSGQLQTLSELVELLTYRMLDMEERLVGQADQLFDRQLALEQGQGDAARVMEERLRETEDRLGRLEGLLRTDIELPPSQPSLRAIAPVTPVGKPSRFSKNEPSEVRDRLDSPRGETPAPVDLPLETDCIDQPLAS
jgi:hypothetical protein